MLPPIASCTAHEDAISGVHRKHQVEPVFEPDPIRRVFVLIGLSSERLAKERAAGRRQERLITLLIVIGKPFPLILRLRLQL